MSKVPKIALLVMGAGIAVAIFYAGISSLLNGSAGDGDKGQLEAAIRSRLPRKLERIQGAGVKMKSLNCTETETGRFNCDARMQPADADGDSEILDLKLAASCNSTSCGWQVTKKSISNPVSSTSTEGSKQAETSERAEPEYGWSAMTCGEVAEAVEGHELQWLAGAGEAVAYTAIASSPDGNEERLTTEAARALVAVCSRASSPGYQPYEAAEATFLQSLERRGR